MGRLSSARRGATIYPPFRGGGSEPRPRTSRTARSKSADDNGFLRLLAAVRRPCEAPAGQLSPLPTRRSSIRMIRAIVEASAGQPLCRCRKLSWRSPAEESPISPPCPKKTTGLGATRFHIRVGSGHKTTVREEACGEGSPQAALARPPSRPRQGGAAGE